MTSSLDKYNLKVVVALLVMFSVLSVYPIVNYVITNNFVDEFSKNIEELSLTYYIKGNSAINYASNYLYASCIVQECN